MCEVVNIKNSEYDVYIGRAGKGQDGYFGNPFSHLKGDGDRNTCITKFKDYAYKRLVYDTEWAEKIKALKGKKLGCFCKPLACHGDILKRICEELND